MAKLEVIKEGNIILTFTPEGNGYDIEIKFKPYDYNIDMAIATVNLRKEDTLTIEHVRLPLVFNQDNAKDYPF